MSCIFCSIANGTIPSNFIYEDETVVAFNDIKPAAPVHILIVPKAHYTDAVDLAKQPEAGAVMAAVLQAAAAIAEQLGLEQGFRLINNCGAGAGQTVMHVHFHLLSGEILAERLV